MIMGNMLGLKRGESLVPGFVIECLLYDVFGLCGAGCVVRGGGFRAW